MILIGSPLLFHRRDGGVVADTPPAVGHRRGCPPAGGRRRPRRQAHGRPARGEGIGGRDDRACPGDKVPQLILRRRTGRGRRRIACSGEDAHEVSRKLLMA